jgi:hypothetical protein
MSENRSPRVTLRRGGRRDYHELVQVHPQRSRARTYILNGDVINRLNALALAHQVGVSDLVDYLLAQVLDQVDDGRLEIKTCSRGLRMIERT